MTKIIIGNWKMNPASEKEAISIYKEIKKNIPKSFRDEICICPPSIFLSSLKKVGVNSKISLGAQDIFYENEGSYTGNIGGSMVSLLGAKYVILGHSEMRALGETDEIISKKITNAFKNGLIPVLCVGEKYRNDAREYFSFVASQLECALKNIPKVLIKKVIIAYEPVWAIGKDAIRDANTEECLEMSIFIKKHLADIAGQKAINGLCLLYGGSVSEKNAKSFLNDGGVDGLLVGRASLNPKNFIKIIEQV